MTAARPTPAGVPPCPSGGGGPLPAHRPTVMWILGTSIQQADGMIAWQKVYVTLVIKVVLFMSNTDFVIILLGILGQCFQLVRRACK